MYSTVVTKAATNVETRSYEEKKFDDRSINKAMVVADQTYIDHCWLNGWRLGVLILIAWQLASIEWKQISEMIEYLICWSIKQLTNKFCYYSIIWTRKWQVLKAFSMKMKKKKFKFSLFSVILTKYSKWDQ